MNYLLFFLKGLEQENHMMSTDIHYLCLLASKILFRSILTYPQDLLLVERSLIFTEQNNFVSKVLDLFTITRIVFRHVGMRYLRMGGDDDSNSARANNVNSEVQKILWKVKISTKFHFLSGKYCMMLYQLRQSFQIESLAVMLLVKLDFITEGRPIKD